MLQYPELARVSAFQKNLNRSYVKMKFSDDQYNAASSFAYTMIVVDDEPMPDRVEVEPPAEVKTPGRRDIAAAQHDDKKPEAQQSHPLESDSKLTQQFQTHGI